MKKRVVLINGVAFKVKYDEETRAIERKHARKTTEDWNKNQLAE